MRSSFTAAVLAVLVAVSAAAVDLPPARGISPDQPRVFPPPALREVAAQTLVELPALTEAEAKSLNAEEGGRLKVGIVRPLASAMSLRPEKSASTTGGRIHARIAVENAGGIRLKLDVSKLDRDAILWVYDREEQPIGFDLSTAYEGMLWSPTIWSDAATIEVAGRGDVSLLAIAELAKPVENGNECFRDVSCQSTDILEMASAVALYGYVKGGEAYVCTGALIIDSNESFAPYFLTANHCVSTQAEASTVEAFWDYRRSSCAGVAPSLSSRPRSSGATLLATSASTDVTLLRLAAVPGTRYWLGWDPATVPHGKQIFHISHAEGGPQVYSASVVDTTTPTCTSSPRGPYIHSTMQSGATAPGSSGGPAMFGDGYIVGQLRGACGPDPANPCDYRNREVDGALAQSYPLLKPWIDPTPTTCSACTPSATTACLLGNRFKVTMEWENRFGATMRGSGKTIRYTENRADVHPSYGPLSEVAFFSMYDHAPNTVEVIVKLFKGVAINDKFWVYLTGFSNAEYTVNVTDTQTCRTWSRRNLHNNQTLTTDFEAFPFP